MIDLICLVSFIQGLCAADVEVESIQSIRVTGASESIYRTKALPALFAISIRLTVEPQVLNTDAIAARLQEISSWDPGSDCPLSEIPEVLGRAFEYDNDPKDFKSVLLTVFETLLLEFGDVSHVRKYVMDKVNPRTSISTRMISVHRCTSPSNWPSDRWISRQNG